MFFIPGWLVSIATFPGVIIHEWSHKKFCEWLGVPVHKVVYFQVGNPAGYVIHEQPKIYKQTFWISIGPLIVNSSLTILLSIVASRLAHDGWLYILLIWLAFSVGMHSFPSDQDMKHVSEGSKLALKNDGSSFHYLAFPFVWLIFISNKLRLFWFDFFYAYLLVFLGGGL